MDPPVQLVHLGERLCLASRPPSFGAQALFFAGRLDPIDLLEIQKSDRRVRIAALGSLLKFATDVHPEAEPSLDGDDRLGAFLSVAQHRLVARVTIALQIPGKSRSIAVG